MHDVTEPELVAEQRHLDATRSAYERILAALAATAVIAGFAILFVFASLLESGLSGN